MLGMIGGFIGIGSMFPQILKTYRTRSAEGLSLARWLLTVASCALWLLHGILNGDASIMTVNPIYLVLELVVIAGIVLFGGVRFRRAGDGAAEGDGGAGDEGLPAN